MKKPPRFTPVRDPNGKSDLTARLIASFKQLIAGGSLSPGSRLPPERQLAAQFGVSRSSLRQALKVLETIGIVSQHVGDGTYFNTDWPSVLSEPIDFLFLLGSISKEELFDLRLLVEPALAARAAGRATSDDLAALEDVIQSMRKDRKHPRQFLEHDVAFHGLVIRIAGNRASQLLFDVIHRALLTTFLGMPLQANATIAFHHSIVDAIKSRKAGEARRRMEDHLLSSRDALRDSQNRRMAPKRLEVASIPKLPKRRKPSAAGR